jgi:hypothetical protein
VATVPATTPVTFGARLAVKRDLEGARAGRIEVAPDDRATPTALIARWRSAGVIETETTRVPDGLDQGHLGARRYKTI